MTNKTVDFDPAIARRDFTTALAGDGWGIEPLDDPTLGGSEHVAVDDEPANVKSEARYQSLSQLTRQWRYQRSDMWGAVCDVQRTLPGDTHPNARCRYANLNKCGLHPAALSPSDVVTVDHSYPNPCPPSSTVHLPQRGV